MLSSFQLGTGPKSVVLLHGFLGSGKNLTTFAKKLSSQNPSLTIVVPDVTGHGASPMLPSGASLSTIADDVLSLIRELHLPEPFWVVGHSLGGRVALSMFERSPSSLARVAILDITPGKILLGQTETQMIAEMLLQAPSEGATRDVFRAYFREKNLSSSLVDWLLMNLYSQDNVYKWRIDRQSLFDLLISSNQKDLWQSAEKLSSLGKLRCINGGLSSYVSAQDVARLEQSGAEVVSLARAGHFVHVDALPELLSSLSDFFVFV
jgi:esterase